MTFLDGPIEAATILPAHHQRRKSLFAVAALEGPSLMFITTSQIFEPALSQPKRPEQKIFSRNRSFRPALPALTQLTCTDKGQGHGKNRPFSEARLFPTKSTRH